MDSAEQKHFAVARMTLETLVNTYPTSEYADKARLALEDPQIAGCGDTSSDCQIAEPAWPN
jgi:hypothetical protein